MTDYRSLARRLIAPVLAAAVLGIAGLNSPSAGAAAASISQLQVQPGGVQATVRFTTSEPTTVSVDYRPAGAAASSQAAASGTQGVVAAPRTAPLLAGEAVIVQLLQTASTAHERTLSGLTSNTAYDVSVVATTQSGQRLTAQTRFTTLKQRVRVTLREITISNDGDTFLTGDGEPAWFVSLHWPEGSTSGCYPNTDVGFGGVCQYDSRGTGRFVPRNNHGAFLAWTFAEENFDRFPAEFKPSAVAKEGDTLSLGAVGQFFEGFAECIKQHGCPFSISPAQGPWMVPQGVEWASTVVRIKADDSNTGFESELAFTFELFHDNLSYPSARNAPSSTWRSPFGR